VKIDVKLLYHFKVRGQNYGLQFRILKHSIFVDIQNIQQFGVGLNQFMMIACGKVLS